jgi:hypothetical protein
MLKMMTNVPSLLSKFLPERGSKRRSPVASSKTMQAMDHMSTGVEYLAPTMASSDRYCRVWMSSVKCLWVQHALPKSTIFTV